MKIISDMMNTADAAFEEFINFKAEYLKMVEDDMSETDTRSKVLDKLFLDVLGWKEGDIKREDKVESGFYDYKFSLPGLAFIVEAKRNFVDFALPDRGKVVSLNTLNIQNADVVKQIRNYLDDLGLSKGIISNGREFIIGTFFNNNGKPWRQNKCLIYRSFEDIESRFFEFYDNISREAIIANGGFKFENEGNVFDFGKIISSIPDSDRELIRNTLSSSITPIIEQIFGEMFDGRWEADADFIHHCFVNNDEIRKNRDEIDKLFSDIAPILGEVIPAMNSASVRRQIVDEVANDARSSKIVPPKPVVIIGSRGAGKSTFINYLFKQDEFAEALSNHPHVYIDFRNYFDKNENIDVEKIAHDVLEKLYEGYSEMSLHGITALKRIYYKEIARNDESIWSYLKENDHLSYNAKVQLFLESKLSNALSHLENLSQYLVRERRKRIIIIIDNADQFNIKVQERVFTFSHSLYQAAQCGIIISLREGYYHKWRSAPPFDAYKSNVYHISAPKYGVVLQKRLDFALSHLSVSGRTAGPIGASMNLTIKNQEIVDFLGTIRKSLFDNENSPLLKFLRMTTFPNIREGLELFKTFLVSGHTNISEYILRERFGSGASVKVIPIHEFIKAIALNNKLYYNHEISVIINVFYPASGSNDHFNKVRIMKVLDRQISDREHGKPVPLKDIVNVFTNLGINPSIINKEIHELFKYSLLDSDQLLSDTDWNELDYENVKLSLTSKGYYYLHDLISRMHYLELVSQDTPIYDSDLFSEMRTCFNNTNSSGKQNLNTRIKLVEIFLKYLVSREEMNPKEILLSIGSVVDSIFIESVNSELSSIKSKLT
jgi:GTPase SAR1 family protein